MMPTGLAIPLAVGKTLEPRPVKQKNLFGLINMARMTTFHLRMITPEPSSGCPFALNKSWQWNLSVIYPESNHCNETDHLDNNATHTSNHGSNIVMACSLEAICRCDGTMGCSPEGCPRPISSTGMPESWKDKPESLGVSRLLDGD
jgi:hypothetical protein